MFVKQTHSVKDKFYFQSSFATKIRLFKYRKTIHSVKDKFYFQFSFAKKSAGLNDSEKMQVFFSDSALVIWSPN